MFQKDAPMMPRERLPSKDQLSQTGKRPYWYRASWKRTRVGGVVRATLTPRPLHAGLELHRRTIVASRICSRSRIKTDFYYKGRYEIFKI